ncbi:uncharacterized protein LOC132303669 [Cornus florida]|uniref:uncharacterized protein LOC132303669 n=1 Tax=Cornus florida TaxID=4283 RepID=UPI00289FE9C4|nr:uncharacterized protein LOC132303669 [Cornus florida]
MDSPETEKASHIVDSPETKKEGLHYVLLRLSLAILFLLFAFVFASFLVVFVTLSIGNSSITNPISVPSQCRIVSSSVDLRSSKVCELGLLNYKAKHVFYPFERKKFRCRHDYYWASVFKVEYEDHSGQTQLAFAEAPNEALPIDCRPNFGVAWLTKDRFKVNETYDCWYTFGISKVNIYHDRFFNCQANDPSTVEMLRRYSVLSTRMLKSWFSSIRKAKYWKWEVIAGVVTGFSTSLISISLIRLLQQLKSCLPRIYAARLKRTCFFVAYFSFAGWLAIQYGKRLGLLEIFGV